MNNNTTTITNTTTTMNINSQKLVNEHHITPDALDFIKTLTVHLWVGGVGEREFSLKEGPEAALTKIQKWVDKGRWFDPYDSGVNIVLFDDNGALYELSSGHVYSVGLRLYDALQAVERKFASERKDDRFTPTFVLIGKKYRIADKAKDGTVIPSAPVVELDNYEY